MAACSVRLFQRSSQRCLAVLRDFPASPPSLSFYLPLNPPVFNLRSLLAQPLIYSVSHPSTEEIGRVRSELHGSRAAK